MGVDFLLIFPVLNRTKNTSIQAPEGSAAALSSRGISLSTRKSKRVFIIFFVFSVLLPSGKNQPGNRKTKRRKTKKQYPVQRQNDDKDIKTKKTIL
jgi:hypothetical protein